jgi:hypothetical protein
MVRRISGRKRVELFSSIITRTVSFHRGSGFIDEFIAK